MATNRVLFRDCAGVGDRAFIWLRFLLWPLNYIMPGGDRFHDPLGLEHDLSFSKGIYGAQLLWHISILVLCFIDLPAVEGWVLGREVLETRFAANMRGFFYGGIPRERVGVAMLDSSLL